MKIRQECKITVKIFEAEKGCHNKNTEVEQKTI